MQWSDVKLAANAIVPGSSIPAILNFHGDGALMGQMWTKMWFHDRARDLLKWYVKSPDDPVAAQVAMEGVDRWWDLRGGKGGVWTDRGEWLDWNEVCGEFHEEGFGDGKGEFGSEKEAVEEEGPVYNIFGKLVKGSKRPADRRSRP